MNTAYPIEVGTVAGNPIIANGNEDGYSRIVSVTLKTDYRPINPPGFPSRPPAGASVPWSPVLIPAGTTRQFYNCEADALVAAGAASYA